MLELFAQPLTIPALDGYALSALLLTPKDPPKGVIQFHAGTVVKKEFHLKLAKFLAQSGYVVLLFDYRGVGASRPKSLRGFSAAISDWGRLDATAVLDFLSERYPDLPIHLLAHSMGGQILGLMPNWEKFDQIIVLASSSGNYHNFAAAYQYKVRVSVNILFPIVLPLIGYALGRFGLKDDWPKGVAEEWWQNSRQNGLMAHFMEAKFPDATFYKKIDKKITAWFFSDDHMATARTVPNFQISYPQAQVTTVIKHPKEYQLKAIGHFGIFKQKTGLQLWEELVLTLTS